MPLPRPPYPRCDDQRYHYTLDQPGVYFDLPLASYITNPPILGLEKNTRSHMKIPHDQDDLETMGFNAAIGCSQLQDVIPLETNRADVTSVDARAYSDARIRFNTADKTVSTAFRNLKLARTPVRAFLMMTVDLLSPTVGKDPNAEWKEIGFSDHSLAVPNGEDQLLPMLRKVKAYLTAHPELALADPRFNFTAARAGQLLDALQAAVSNDDITNNKPLGLKPAENAAADAMKIRQLAEAALIRRLHGLYGELEQKIDPLSPYWVQFGFDQPGAVARPDPVAALTGEALGGGRVKLSWTGAARSERFQIWMQTEGETGWSLIDRTSGETEKLLENLTVGAKLKFRVRGANATNVGKSSPVWEVTVG